MAIDINTTIKTYDDLSDMARELILWSENDEPCYLDWQARIAKISALGDADPKRRRVILSHITNHVAYVSRSYVDANCSPRFRVSRHDRVDAGSYLLANIETDISEYREYHFPVRDTLNETIAALIGR